MLTGMFSYLSSFKKECSSNPSFIDKVIAGYWSSFYQVRLSLSFLFRRKGLICDVRLLFSTMTIHLCTFLIKSNEILLLSSLELFKPHST